MGRVPQAAAGRASTRWPSSAGPATTAIPTISSSRCELRRGAAGGGNARKWCNKQFEDLIMKAATISDQAERAKLYEQAQVIMQGRRRGSPIAHSVRVHADAQGGQRLQDGPVRAAISSTSVDNAEMGSSDRRGRHRRASLLPCFLPGRVGADRPDVHRRHLARLRADPPHSRRSGRDPGRASAAWIPRGARAAARVRPRPAAAGAIRRPMSAACCTAISARRSPRTSRCCTSSSTLFPATRRARGLRHAVRGRRRLAGRHHRGGQARHRSSTTA